MRQAGASTDPAKWLRLLLAFCALAIPARLGRADALRFGNCRISPGVKRAATLLQMRLQPQPLMLRDGRHLRLNATLRLDRPLQERWVVALDVHRTLLGLRLRFPCVAGLGSCRQSIARYRQRFPAESDWFLQQLGVRFEQGQAANGTYQLRELDARLHMPRGSPISRTIRTMGRVRFQNCNQLFD